ncbi:MAG TPA: hypothetical protein PKI19_07050 [Elusimicrobiales bacterium]|nr:hypothetical protein [Elusimicrobiales bacterium]
MILKEIQKLKIALTTDCVLACRHCRVDKAAGLTVSFRDAARAVDLLIRSPGDSKRLELYGGEPFLKFALLKKITLYARRRAGAAGKPLSVSVASNGLVLDAERLGFLRKNRVNLSISVSGSAENHDSCRVYPGGRGSYGDLQKKLKLVFSGLDARDVVALECVAPAGAAGLAGDLRRLAAGGFSVINIECVHGRPWSRASLAALDRSLRAFSGWLLKSVRAGRYVAPEPFLEFFRTKGAGPVLDCPLYRDLELYPDGTLSFYPFAFIDYPAVKRSVAVGSAARGLNRRYAGCYPGCGLCGGCVREYYVIGGLSSGARAYTLRTGALKKVFLEVMRRAGTEKIFKDYARWLAELKSREYIKSRHGAVA